MLNSINTSEIFQFAHDAMLVINPVSNQIIISNEEASSLLGYSKDTFRKTSVSQLFRQSFKELIVLTDAVLEKGKCWDADINCCAANGESISVELSASRINNPQQELIVLILRNNAVIQRQRNSAEINSIYRHGLGKWKTIEAVFKEIERENQLILSAVGEGIYGVNANGETTFVNPAAERMLGWPVDELIGHNIHAAIHHSKNDGNHYPSSHCPIFASIHDGEVHHIDNEVFWRKDGSCFHVEYTSTPIRDNGRLVGAVVIFRDISDRKQTESNLHRALEEVDALRKKLELENAYLQEEFRTEHNYKEIVGKSAIILKTIDQIDLVAPTDANVLIHGESGTGKELIARAIHQGSERSHRPLIRVNCASIPHDLFESEFFGHIKGAFTGAISDRLGRFELADGGTLFLDEVGEIPLELQSKLLRVLQEKQFERIGDNQTRNSNVRLIAATNRDLKKDVSSGMFREDLYYRLNVFPIESVPLRQRPEDIPLLANHFFIRATNKFKKNDIKLSVADIERLRHYSWPGNIRELINVIERSVILSRHGKLYFDLQKSDKNLPDESSAHKITEQTLLTESDRYTIEKDNIIRALNISKGKVFGTGGAAELLNVKPTTLSSRIKKMKINRYQFCSISTAD